MSGWDSVPLGELAADEKSAISKPYGSAILKEDYRAEGVPVVRGVNLANGIFNDGDFVYIDEELAAKMPGAEMRSGDLVVTHRGTVGQVSMIPRLSRFPRYVASTSHVKVRLDEAKAVPEFYYYWFASPQGQHSILSNVSTVGVPGLVQPVATVKKLQVPCPRPAEQRAIAQILGALDDKIAANRRLADVGFVLQTSLWRKHSDGCHGVPLLSIATPHLGGTPPRADESAWEGAIPWASVRDMSAAKGGVLLTTTETISIEASQSARRLATLPERSVVLTARGTVGKVVTVGVPCAINQSAYGFIPVPGRGVALRCSIESVVDELKARAHGSVFSTITMSTLEGALVPDTNDRAWDAVCVDLESIEDRRVAALCECEILARTRDELLPLLMSGKIRLKDAEAAVSEVL